ncbi:MAG: hypothetical protein LQ343_003630 [Gyalolechia ehrenbergii]|nr:MAG: hypothetical protein LQ343_003630 [Gyalolechia ehrenbergii]
MKIILTGATGFIGGEVLRFALLHPSINSIVVLSRRQLPNQRSQTHQACAGAEACIWSLGVARALSAEQDRKINLDYTVTAARTFTDRLAPNLAEGRKFRFVYLSGMLTERDPNKSLWFMKEARLIRVSVPNEV